MTSTSRPAGRSHRRHRRRSGRTSWQCGPSSCPPIMDLSDVSVFYGDYEAVRGTTMPIAHNQITAMIGPSGCGKSHHPAGAQPDERPDPRGPCRGRVTYHGQDLYAPDVDPIEVRRRIGMVFQKPNPFPKSIYDNVAYGLRINGIKATTWTTWSSRRCAGRALGRGEGQAQDQRPGALRRPAAAPLHRPHDRGASPR